MKILSKLAVASAALILSSQAATAQLTPKAIALPYALGTLDCSVRGSNGPNSGPFNLNYTAYLHTLNVGSGGNPHPHTSAHSSQLCKLTAADMCKWTKQNYPNGSYIGFTSAQVNYPFIIRVNENVFGTQRTFYTQCS